MDRLDDPAVMTIEELLERLTRLGVQAQADGDRLRVSAPTGVLTPDLRDQIAARKDALLAALRQAAETDGAPLAHHAAYPDRLPLSFAQQRLWFLEQLEGGRPHYHVPGVYRLRGPLQADALERALRAILDRHASLRTRFDTVDGEPVQVIGSAERFSLPLIDLSETPADQRAEQGRALSQAEVRRPFDLRADLMLRATLLRLAPDEHWLIIVMHHIASDGWSLAAFWDELRTLYGAEVEGRSVTLPPLPLHYVDYALWQRGWLQGDRLAEQLAYWTQALAGLTPQDLPTDHPRPDSLTYHGDRVVFQLDPARLDRLRAVCRREGVTLYMALLAVFAILLQRYTGQDDIAVGAPIAGRRRAELEPLIGFFVNTLVMRLDLSGAPTGREVLRRARNTALDAYDHQDIPFEKLVEELQPERRRNRTPLVQTLFQVLNTPSSAIALPGLSMERLDSGLETVRFDLEVMLVETGNALQGTFIYATDLFERVTIERMVGHYLNLLDQFVADLDAPIASLRLVTPGEERQMLVEWNGPRVDFPPQTSVHRLVEAQATRTPDAPALVWGAASLNYRDLDTRANQLARYLQAQGVGSDVPVGVYMARSPELALALLGILKAGGAYLPLDPAFPSTRLSRVLADSATPLVLTQRRLARDLRVDGVRVVCWEDIEAEWAARDAAALDVALTSDNLAYVMYTSGSTGQPKGVAMRHGALANLLQWHQAHPVLGRPARVVQFTSVTFDVSFQEIFSTWATGGALYLVSEEERQDLGRLSQTLREARIERLFAPFVVLHHLAQIIADDERGPYALREVVTAGEQLKITPALRQMMRRLDGATLHNHYGPTETHVVSELILAGPPEGWPALPSIGRPIANTRLLVLDRGGQLCPVGVAGELVIGGAALAAGYWRRADLTAERFIPDPWRQEAGARLYRTGDQARRTADGEIEFLGRLDDQVKIRGFRVEPAEIEAALREQPGVGECAVVAVEASGGERRLVAYIAPAAGASLQVEALRAALRRSLPDYMIPTALVELERLPTTPNGKLDRRALPAPTIQTSPSLVNARDSLEAQLTQVWQAVLGVPRVGVHDGFFALGGHSLLAVQLMDRIYRLTGQRLPIASIFEASTIAQQADLLRRQGHASAWQSLVPIQPQGTRPPLFLVPPAGGTTLRFAGLVSALGPDQPVYGLEPLGMDGASAPQDTVDAMAERYLSEVQALWPTGPYWLGGVCFGAVVALEMAQRLAAAGFGAPLLVVFDASPPANGPAWTYARRTPARVMRQIGRHMRRGTLHWAVRGFVEDQLIPHTLRRKGKPEWAIRAHNAHVIAYHRYVARPYAGRVILLMSEQLQRYGYDERWAQLSERLDSHVFPATTHMELLRGEFMPVLGAKLAATLSEEATRLRESEAGHGAAHPA